MKKTKLDMGALAAAVINKPETTQPTAPSKSGAMTQASGSKAFAQTRTITTKKVDPKRCRIWGAHDRNTLWFNPTDCADLIAGFKSLGQQKTAIVRQVKNDPFFQYEIIEGARRRWTAEYLDMLLEVEVRNISDTEAAAMMESENADRQDISPFERAQSYDRLLNMGVFSNRESLCEAMNVSKANLTKMITAANLVKVELLGPLITKLIPDVREISIVGAYKLMQEWAKSDDIKGAIIQAANQMIKAGTPITATKALKLLALAPYDQPKKEKNTYYTDTGKPLLTGQKHQNGQMVFTVNKVADGVKKSDIKKALNEALADLI